MTNEHAILKVLVTRKHGKRLEAGRSKKNKYLTIVLLVERSDCSNVAVKRQILIE
jgi:hypothetical protein